MRKLLLAAVLLAIVAPVQAQPTEYGFTDDYLVRVGQGDLSLVSGTEPAGWTIAEYLRVDHDGNETSIPAVSTQGEVLSFGCDDCNATYNEELNTYGLGTDTPEGEYVFRLVRTIEASDAVVFDLAIYGGQAADLVVYLPLEHRVDTGATLTTTGLTCTTGDCTIEQYRLSGATHIAILPGTAVVAEPDEDSFLEEWVPAILGVLVGIALWSYLVSKGIVQKRRKQEIQKAAHVEAAESESKDSLTARKRVLMAGLKELEKAKMTKEIDTDTYDALKAELKKETVTVMRALEQSE